jgi:hypothetical protein
MESGQRHDVVGFDRIHVGPLPGEMDIIHQRPVRKSRQPCKELRSAMWETIAALAIRTCLMRLSFRNRRLAEPDRQAVHLIRRKSDSPVVRRNQPSLFKKLLSRRFEIGT